PQQNVVPANLLVLPIPDASIHGLASQKSDLMMSVCSITISLFDSRWASLFSCDFDFAFGSCCDFSLSDFDIFSSVSVDGVSADEKLSAGSSFPCCSTAVRASAEGKLVSSEI